MDITIKISSCKSQILQRTADVETISQWVKITKIVALLYWRAKRAIEPLFPQIFEGKKN